MGQAWRILANSGMAILDLMPLGAPLEDFSALGLKAASRASVFASWVYSLCWPGVHSLGRCPPLHVLKSAPRASLVNGLVLVVLPSCLPVRCVLVAGWPLVPVCFREAFWVAFVVVVVVMTFPCLVFLAGPGCLGITDKEKQNNERAREGHVFSDTPDGDDGVYGNSGMCRNHVGATYCGDDATRGFMRRFRFDQRIVDKSLTRSFDGLMLSISSVVI